MTSQSDYQMLIKLKNDFRKEQSLYRKYKEIRAKFYKPAPYHMENAQLTKKIFVSLKNSIIVPLGIVLSIFIICVMFSFIWLIFGSHFWDKVAYYLLYIFSFCTYFIYSHKIMTYDYYNSSTINSLMFFIYALICLVLIFLIINIIILVTNYIKIDKNNNSYKKQYEEECKKWEKQDFKKLKIEYQQCKNSLEMVRNEITNNYVLGYSSKYKEAWIVEKLVEYFQERKAETISSALILFDHEMRENQKISIMENAYEEMQKEQQMQTQAITKLSNNVNKRINDFEDEQRRLRTHDDIQDLIVAASLDRINDKLK